MGDRQAGSAVTRVALELRHPTIGLACAGPIAGNIGGGGTTLAIERRRRLVGGWMKTHPRPANQSASDAVTAVPTTAPLITSLRK